MRARHYRAGHTILFVVIAVLVVGVIGGGGWLVFEHNKTKVTTAATDNKPVTSQQHTTNPSSSDSTSTTVTIQVPELGINITVPSDLSDLVYRTTTVTLRNGNQATIAYFSTKTLTNADAKCGTNFGPLGSLEKASGQYPTQQQDETNVLDYGQLVKQFPDFYIAAGYPNASCTTNSLPQPTSGASWQTQFSNSTSTIQATN